MALCALIPTDVSKPKEKEKRASGSKKELYKDVYKPSAYLSASRESSSDLDTFNFFANASATVSLCNVH